MYNRITFYWSCKRDMFVKFHEIPCTFWTDRMKFDVNTHWHEGHNEGLFILTHDQINQLLKLIVVVVCPFSVFIRCKLNTFKETVMLNN